MLLNSFILFKPLINMVKKITITKDVIITILIAGLSTMLVGGGIPHGFSIVGFNNRPTASIMFVVIIRLEIKTIIRFNCEV